MMQPNDKIRRISHTNFVMALAGATKVTEFANDSNYSQSFAFTDDSTTLWTFLTVESIKWL